MTRQRLIALATLAAVRLFAAADVPEARPKLQPVSFDDKGGYKEAVPILRIGDKFRFKVPAEASLTYQFSSKIEHGRILCGGQSALEGKIPDKDETTNQPVRAIYFNLRGKVAPSPGDAAKLQDLLDQLAYYLPLSRLLTWREKKIIQDRIAAANELIAQYQEEIKAYTGTSLQAAVDAIDRRQRLIQTQRQLIKSGQTRLDNNGLQDQLSSLVSQIVELKAKYSQEAILQRAGVLVVGQSDQDRKPVFYKLTKSEDASAPWRMVRTQPFPVLTTDDIPYVMVLGQRFNQEPVALRASFASKAGSYIDAAPVRPLVTQPIVTSRGENQPMNFTIPFAGTLQYKLPAILAAIDAGRLSAEQLVSILDTIAQANLDEPGLRQIMAAISTKGWSIGDIGKFIYSLMDRGIQSTELDNIIFATGNPTPTAACDASANPPALAYVDKVLQFTDKLTGETIYSVTVSGYGQATTTDTVTTVAGGAAPGKQTKLEVSRTTLKPLDNDAWPQVHSLYRYNLATGLLWSTIRTPSFSRVPNGTYPPGCDPSLSVTTTPSNGTSVTTTCSPSYGTLKVDGGPRLIPALLFTLYPVKRDTQIKTVQWKELLPAPTIGLSLNSPLDDFFIGASSELKPFRNIQLVYGLHLGRIPKLGANSVQLSTDSTAPVTTMTLRTGAFVGLTFNIDFLKGLFKP